MDPCSVSERCNFDSRLHLTHASWFETGRGLLIRRVNAGAAMRELTEHCLCSRVEVCDLAQIEFEMNWV